MVNPFLSRERRGRFLASTAVRPRAAEARVNGQKPTEVGEAANAADIDETSVNKGQSGFEGCPRRGDRGGDTLNRWMFVEMSPEFIQTPPPFPR